MWLTCWVVLVVVISFGCGVGDVMLWCSLHLWCSGVTVGEPGARLTIKENKRLIRTTREKGWHRCNSKCFTAQKKLL